MKKTIFIKVALICVGALIVLNGIVAASVSNLNTGLFLTFGIGMLLVAFGFLFYRIPKWTRLALFICLCVIAVSATAVFVIGSCDSATYEEDAVVVLGAGLRGDRPSLTLKNRLDRAVDYYEKNPDCLIVVTGGQGPGEDITEALAMERYLINAGIPIQNIIKEELSTSTYENFKNAKNLLDSRLGKDYIITLITNDFHVIRATAIAQKTGFDSPTHLNSSTPIYTALPSVLRECLAILKFIFFG